jgi:hypothetical protein
MQRQDVIASQINKASFMEKYIFLGHGIILIIKIFFPARLIYQVDIE